MNIYTFLIWLITSIRPKSRKIITLTFRAFGFRFRRYIRVPEGYGSKRVVLWFENLANRFVDASQNTKNKFGLRLFQTIRFGALFLLILSCQSTPDRLVNQPLTKNIDLQGHRGARGLRPENTIPAFKEALRYNMTTIELDTTLTRDNQLIVHHDTQTNAQICQGKELTQMTNQAIRTLTVAQLKTLDCGTKRHPKFPQQVPVIGATLITLPEFFVFVRDYLLEFPRQRTVFFNIEIKLPPVYPKADMLLAARLMVEAIEEANVVSQSTVQSFAIEVLPKIKELNPQIATSALFSPSYSQGLQLILGLDANREAIIVQAMAAGVDIISPYYLYVNHDFVKKSHRHKLLVIPWTVNESDQMQKMFLFGVDGIISDYPDILYATYQQWIRKRSNADFYRLKDGK